MEIIQRRASLIVDATRLARELSAVLTEAERVGAGIMLEVEHFSLDDKPVVEVRVRPRKEADGHVG